MEKEQWLTCASLTSCREVPATSTISSVHPFERALISVLPIQFEYSQPYADTTIMGKDRLKVRLVVVPWAKGSLALGLIVEDS